MLQDILKKYQKIIVVEPESADCVLKSIENEKLTKVNINKESIMGGMSCGEVSLVPWKILKNSVNCCVSISDDNVAKTSQLLAHSKLSDNKIVGGECSTPGIIGLIALCNNETVKKNIGLNINSNVLLIGCEGDADQELYNHLLKQ